MACRVIERCAVSQHSVAGFFFAACVPTSQHMSMVLNVAVSQHSVAGFAACVPVTSSACRVVNVAFQHSVAGFAL
jgi:hypothetical protein